MDESDLNMTRVLITLTKFDDGDNAQNFEILLTDNVVYLKIKLSDKIGRRPQDFSIHSTDAVNNPLDDNILIPSINANLFYTVSNEPSDDIILHIKRNYYGIPKFVQFSKFTTIGQLISKLKILYNIQNNLYILQANGLLTDNNSTLEECKLFDNSKVKVWVGDCFKINITLLNPLKTKDESSTQVVGKFEFPVNVTVANLKEYIQKEFGKFRNLQLFTDTSILVDNKQLSSYPLDRECNIYYVDMKKEIDITINTNTKIKGKYAEEFSCTINLPVKEQCVAYAYDCKLTDFNRMKILKYEIVTRLMLPYGDEYPFVELLTMYTEQSKLYIVTENMPGGSLRSHLESPLEPPLEALAIIKYCKQILEGLKIMHEMKIIHRNINCGSVFIDGKGNVKLSNFHFSKFLYKFSSDTILSGIKGSKVGEDARFVAPEVLLGEPYGFKADVWSFGATLIEMVTLKHPYPNLNNKKAIDRIEKTRTIVHDRNLYPGTNFDAIIDKCISSKQLDRPTIQNLLQSL